MTKLVKKLLISLMAVVMTACCGFAVVGAQPITANAATAEYGVQIGGVKVTSDNLVIDNSDNSAITGTATYDPTSNTLTLDNFSYTSVGMVVEGAIVCDNTIDSLNIVLKGTNTISTTADDWDNSDGGIILKQSNATLRISDYVGDDSTGVLNITSGYYGIKFNGGTTTEPVLTLVNVTLNIDTYWPGITAARYVSITKSTLMIQTGPKANYTAFNQLKGIIFSNGAENYNVYNSNSPTTPVTTDKTQSSTYSYKYIKIEPVEGTPYDVWVAGIQLDSTNTTIDINDNSAVTGSATYDPTSDTLTLDNFSYTGAGYLYETVKDPDYDDYYYYNYAGIYSKGDLKIALNGENTLNCAIIDDSDNIEKKCVGINIEGALTISGGTLNTTIKGNSIIANSLTIDNAILNSNSTRVNISFDEDAIISNSKVFAKGGSPVIATGFNKKLDIINSTVVIQSEGSYFGFSNKSAITIDENSILEISVRNCAIGNTIAVNYSPNCSVFAGESKETAQLVAEPYINSTFTSKYVKIAPTSKVTLNYGTSELANKEITVVKGETLSLETPEINGYECIGWYNEDTLENVFDFSTPITEDITIYAKWVVAYDIWVAGIRLNVENLIIDSNDNSAITGTATYDAENNILTLDNFVYTGNVNALIYSTGIDLKIVLKGTNKLVGSVDVNAGIYIEEGSLIIAGSDEYSETASLELTAESSCIYADDSLSIENVKLTTTTTALPTGNGSPTYTILAYGDLSIISSEVTVIAGDSDGDGIIEFGYTVGIMSVGKVEITGSSVTVSANGGGIGAYISITIDNSTVIIDGGIYGIAADATSIKNSTVIISGEIAIGTNSEDDGYLIISNSNVEISAQKYIIRNMNYDEPVIDYSLDSTGHVIYGGEDKESATMLTEQDDIFTSKYLRFVPAYDIWVAGVQLDASNLTIDSEDNNAIRGSATYDPTSNTLTLDNFVYESIGDYRGNNDYAPIRVKDGTTIKVVGSIDLACNGTTDDDYYAIYGLGSLTIIGNGDSDVLYTHGHDGGGIYSSGTLTIQNLELKLNANQSAIYSERAIALDKVSGEIYSWREDGIYVSDFYNSVNILDCNLLIQGYHKGITANSSVVCFKNSFVEIVSDDGYALWDNDRSAVAYVDYSDKHFVFAGWYEDEAEEVNPYDANSFKNNYVKIVPTRKITLNFSSAGLPSEEVFVIVNTPAIIETPVIEGYVFIGWYNEDTLETVFDFSAPITENITIYAKLANYTQDMADIDSQINGVKGSITSLQSSIDGKADATVLANSVADLQGKIDALTNNYQSADDAQQLEIDALKQQVSTLINDTIALLNGKVTDIETEIANIKNDISTNAGDITANAGKIISLTTQLTTLQGVVDSLGDTYIDNTELANLKTELVDADNQIKDLITTLTTKVTDIESEIADINNAISTNAGDITANAGKITSLTTQLTTLQGLVNSLGNTYIDNTELANLKTELVDADNQIKDLITALTTRVTDIEIEIDNIKNDISTNAGDITANAGKITSLTTQLTTLQGVVNSLGDTYIDNTELSNLKAELVDADNQIKGLITALTTRVTDIESEIANIKNDITANASGITANAGKITSLTTQLTTLQGVVNSLGNTYIDNTELANLKAELVDADNQIKDLITTLTTRVEKTENDIASLVSNKADVTLVTEKVEELKGLIDSLDAVKNNYVAADEELKNQLTTVINNAKQQAIDSATELVNNAKAELTIAINAKADTATVNAKVEELNKTIENAKTVANAYTDGKVEELNLAIATAKQQAIDSATTLVNNAKTELNAVIALKADSATVTAKFTEVQSAIAILQGLSDDYLSADTELKEELTTLISNTKAEIIELIIAGDKVNADALEEEIAKLRAEIEALKNATNEDVADLRAEIEALKNATNEDIKEAESNAQVLPSVIASVAVLGDIALLVWLIIKRKIVK